MRNFIVSDLHGNGFVYDSIINYLTNVSLNSNEPVILYINGDLIDRGVDSGSMLIDVYEKIQNDNLPFKIVYLGGNHELLMYNSYLESKDCGLKPLFEPHIGQRSLRWYDRNAGYLTARYLKKFYFYEEVVNICEFIGNLDVYHKFDEKMNDKQILLTHACVVMPMLDNEPLKINDNRTATDIALNTRKGDRVAGRGVGNKDYFTIIGHTRNKTKTGYTYDEDDNVLNIDGGCAAFSYENTCYYHRKRLWTPIEDMYIPYEKYDDEIKKVLDGYSHVPLVEILPNNKLRILTFNHENEITLGNYFEDGHSEEMFYSELSKYRNNLKENPKTLKRINKNIKTY